MNTPNYISPDNDILINQNHPSQSQSQNLITEKIIEAKSGCCVLLIFLFVIIIEGAAIGITSSNPTAMIALIIITVVSLFIIFYMASGFCVIEINEARVLTLFGKYYGTVKTNGFLWVNPFCSKRTVSLKAQNLNGAVIKVNDKHGNPIMMGCVVVWKIVDTAKAVFEVNSTQEYINIQSEGVVREIGTLFPYDKLSKDDTITLKGDQKEINRILVDLMGKRCLTAGIQILEAKITELSYANEIAEVMLKTQAADAVIAARDKIVNGAVSMIGHALKSLDTNDVCKMSREKKAKLVCNMLVILCGESQNNANSSSSYIKKY